MRAGMTGVLSGRAPRPARAAWPAFIVPAGTAGVPAGPAWAANPRYGRRAAGPRRSAATAPLRGSAAAGLRRARQQVAARAGRDRLALAVPRLVGRAVPVTAAAPRLAFAPGRGLLTPDPG